jgi:hypothetical protein
MVSTEVDVVMASVSGRTGCAELTIGVLLSALMFADRTAPMTRRLDFSDGTL